jgi:hypothetical protein
MDLTGFVNVNDLISVTKSTGGCGAKPHGHIFDSRMSDADLAAHTDEDGVLTFACMVPVDGDPIVFDVANEVRRISGNSGTYTSRVVGHFGSEYQIILAQFGGVDFRPVIFEDVVLAQMGYDQGIRRGLALTRKPMTKKEIEERTENGRTVFYFSSDPEPLGTLTMLCWELVRGEPMHLHVVPVGVLNEQIVYRASCEIR